MDRDWIFSFSICLSFKRNGFTILPLRRRFLEMYKKARIIHWGWINTSFSISPIFFILLSCASLTTRGSGWVFFLKEWPINFEKPFCEKSIAQKWNEGIYAKKGMRAWYYWRRRLLLPHTDDASSKCIWGCRLLFPYYLTYFEKKSVVFLEENFSDLLIYILDTSHTCITT